MYKIYINKTLIRLKRSRPNREARPNELIARYAGQVKHLHNFVDMCEKGGKYEAITLYHENYNLLKSDFKGLFTVIEASGGVVVNEMDEILFIFRRGHWDLPKGKIEKGEKKKQAAVREVEEETGVSHLALHDKLCVTKHVYRSKSGKRIIKKSHWYNMSTLKADLIPQTEEDIEEAVWMTLEEFNAQPRVVYSSIKDVLRKYSKSKALV